jgi:hypothetical protein
MLMEVAATALAVVVLLAVAAVDTTAALVTTLVATSVDRAVDVVVLPVAVVAPSLPMPRRQTRAVSTGRPI